MKFLGLRIGMARTGERTKVQIEKKKSQWDIVSRLVMATIDL